MEVLNEQIENFEKVFTLNGFSGCRERCKCGKEFYDTYNQWDWEEGEFEKLEVDENAIGVDYGIQRIMIGGDFYVTSCECWHKLAERYISFLDHYKKEIGKFYELEWHRRWAELDETPIIEEE